MGDHPGPYSGQNLATHIRVAKQPYQPSPLQ